MRTMHVDQCRVNVEDNACVIRLVCPTVEDARHYRDAAWEAMTHGKFRITVESDHGNVVIIPETRR